MDILFSNATVITMDEKKPVINGCYCGVTGTKITYLGTDRPLESAKREIDCNGDILMPGLINAHTHTAMTLLRGFSDDCTLNDWLFNHIFPAEAKLNARAVAAGFSLGVAEMIASGTTSFSDMYFYQDDMAKLAAEFGVRAALSNGVIALSPDYCFEKDRSITEMLNIMKNTDLPKRVHAQMGIHCERTSPPDVWKKAVDFADKHELAMHIHLSETRVDHENCIKETGMTPAERLDKYGVFDRKTIAAHCCYLSESDMKLLAKKGVSAVHSPVSNLKLASGIADIVKMRGNGMNVAIGTDGACSNNTLDLFEDVKVAALLAKNKNGAPSAFTAYDALKLATTNGAKAQGSDDVIGKIAVGFDADVILIDTKKPHRRPFCDALSSVAYCLGGSDVYLTMVEGKILYENGTFTTIDIERVCAEVDNYAAPLIRR